MANRTLTIEVVVNLPDGRDFVDAVLESAEKAEQRFIELAQVENLVLLRTQEIVYSGLAYLTANGLYRCDDLTVDEQAEFGTNPNALVVRFTQSAVSQRTFQRQLRRAA